MKKTSIVGIIILSCAGPPVLAANSYWDCDIASDDKKSWRQAAQDLERHPDDERTFFQACCYYMQMKDWDRIEKMARNAVTRHPDWGSAHYMLGKRAEVLLDEDESLKQFQLAYKYRPEWINCCFAYSGKLCAAGQYKESIAVADAGLKMIHGNAPMDKSLKHYLLEVKFRALMNMHDYDGAAKQYEDSLALGLPGGIRQLQESLAEAYIGGSHCAKGIDILTRLMRTEPRPAKLHLKRAQGYYRQGKYQLALDDVNAFLSGHIESSSVAREYLTHDIEEARRFKANIYEKMGRNDLAKKERAGIDQQSADLYKQFIFRGEEPKGNRKP